LFGGRYQLTMAVKVEVDRHSGLLLSYGSGRVLKVVGRPSFILLEVREVTLNPEGRIEITYQNQWEFGPAEWEKVVAARGDFSVIGIRLNRNNPARNFDEYKAYPINGIRMKEGT
jgi:hypothetical protein